MISYVVGTEDLGMRLDSSVVAHVKTLSRASVQKLNEQGLITVKSKIQKTSYKLRNGDKVVIDYDAKSSKQIPEVDVQIIYEDKDCVVIDKPVGLLSHSKGAFNPEATVATWLIRHYSLTPKNATADSRAGIVHRLDRATSGVMICAKNSAALLFLQKQFSLRQAKKQYVAIIRGSLKPAKAIIDMPIERNPKKPQTFRVGPNGKPATTVYETIKTTGTHSQILLSPTTGRTHQLRVHLSNLKHPIVGDTLYSGEPAKRLYLHALSLEVTLPSHEHHTFTAKLPKDFDKFITSSS